MSIYHRIIRAPSITEKNTTLKEAGKFVFEVDRNATRTEIKQAVEKLFNVNVVKVNTMVVKGKEKRMGRSVGRRPDWKKAIVKIAQGQTISQFGEA